MIRRILFLLVCCLTACNALPGKGESLPDLTGAWSITLNQSGGFAGLNRTVTVKSDGLVTALDARTDQTGSFQLSDSELAALQVQVAAAAFIPPSRIDSGCADCFIYDLQIDTDAGSVHFQADDVTLPESGLQTLVGYMLERMNQALST